MKTTMRTLIVILLMFLLLFPQAVIVPEALAAGENLEAEADDVVAIVNEFTVTQAVNTYFQGRKAFLTSGDAEAFVGTTPSVVRDEQLHLQELQKLDQVFVNSVPEFESMSFESLYAKAVVNETVTYQTGGDGTVSLVLTEIVRHKISLSVNADGELLVVADEYSEAYSAFSSCSYVDLSEAAAEQMAAGSQLCISYVAESQVDYIEGSNNNTKYGSYFSNNYQPWCSMFVTWCARMSNVSSAVIPYEPWVPTMRSHYNNLGRYYKSQSQGGNTAPAVGDLFFYGPSHDDVSHIGIIVAVTSSYITVIEGNAGPNTDRVVDETYSRTSTAFVGFARPNYGATTHAINSTWVYNASYHWKCCDNCDYQVNRAAHSMVQVGAINRCSVCGYSPNVSVNSVGLLKRHSDILKE